MKYSKTKKKKKIIGKGGEIHFYLVEFYFLNRNLLMNFK